MTNEKYPPPEIDGQSCSLCRSFSLLRRVRKSNPCCRDPRRSRPVFSVWISLPYRMKRTRAPRNLGVHLPNVQTTFFRRLPLLSPFFYCVFHRPTTRWIRESARFENRSAAGTKQMRLTLRRDESSGGNVLILWRFSTPKTGLSACLLESIGRYLSRDHTCLLVRRVQVIVPAPISGS